MDREAPAPREVSTTAGQVPRLSYSRVARPILTFQDHFATGGGPPPSRSDPVFLRCSDRFRDFASSLRSPRIRSWATRLIFERRIGAPSNQGLGSRKAKCDSTRSAPGVDASRLIFT